MVNVICWKSFSPKKQSTNDKQYVGIKQLLICCYYWFRYLFLIPNGGQIKFYSYFSRRRRREIHLQFTAQVQVYFRQNLLDKILLVKINYLWTVFFFRLCVCALHYSNMRNWNNIFPWSISATCESLYFQSLYKHKAIWIQSTADIHTINLFVFRYVITLFSYEKTESHIIIVPFGLYFVCKIFSDWH